MIKENIILDFTYESHDTLKSFPFNLVLTIKTITRLNLGEGETFEIKIEKIGRRGSRSPDNAEFDHSRFAEDGKEMYQEL